MNCVFRGSAVGEQWRFGKSANDNVRNCGSRGERGFPAYGPFAEGSAESARRRLPMQRPRLALRSMAKLAHPICKQRSLAKGAA